MQGSKYKPLTKTCPGGETKESADFDISGCRASPTLGNGILSPESRCRLTPGACASTPVVSACAAGRKWSLQGTGIAHCVDEDPICPWGTSLTHDVQGNPACIQNTCPSNQILGRDGKACGCSSGLVLEGEKCVAPTPTCTEASTVTTSEVCTFGGTKFLRETTTCPNGPFGAPQKDTAWDETSCAPTPPVTCTSSTYSEDAACSPGSSGNQTRNVTISCPSGQYGMPATSYGAWNTKNCQLSCAPTSSTYSTACGTGFTGTKYVTTNYSCPSGSTTTENTSGCGCANGANDYPSCTPPPPAGAPGQKFTMVTGSRVYPSSGQCSKGDVYYSAGDPFWWDPNRVPAGSLSPNKANGTLITDIGVSCNYSFNIYTHDYTRDFFTSITLSGVTYYRRDAHVQEWVMGNGEDVPFQYLGLIFTWFNPPQLEGNTKYEVIIE